MNEFVLKLNTVEGVKNFVNIISKSSSEFSLRNTDRTRIVDPKSILGVLSLDLSKEVVLEHDLETIGEILDFHETIKEFLA